MDHAKAMIDETAQKNIDAWLQGSYSKEVKDEIRHLQKENPEMLNDAFYTKLDFGTGGLRGIMGVGTNRMNEYTVAFATQGLANYLKKVYPQNKNLRVLVGYDTRKNSRFFAEVTAKVLAGNQIEVLLYNKFRPVALVSYGVLLKKCDAGVMITASHNPPPYNGYKVYWNHGGQVIPPHDEGIIAEVDAITSPDMVKKASFPHSLIIEMGDDVDAAYLKEIHKLEFHPGVNLSKGKNLSIVYSPLHGGGLYLVPAALKSWGFTNLNIIEEQKSTDGTFPTVKVPNPEEKETLKLGVDALKRSHADLFLATDPDCDRIAAVVMEEGTPFYFNGNEMACMLLEHICRSYKSLHNMPTKPLAIKTIVTTELFKAIGNHYDVHVLDVLTGFKYIGQKIAQIEKEALGPTPAHHFLFGAEESYGYLMGSYARDKDGVISSCLIAELALQLKLEGKTLIDFLYELYKKYGVYREKLFSLSFEGKEGEEKREAIMKKLREHPPKTIGKSGVEIMEDYLTHTLTHMESSHREPLLLPPSNVLRFFLTDQTKIVIRPSGTEPKIKVYVACFEKHPFHNKQDILQAISQCDLKVDGYLGWMKQLLS